jgi:hypothetical protein
MKHLKATLISHLVVEFLERMVLVFLLCRTSRICLLYRAELYGALRAVEVAHQMNWNNLWLKTDSTLVVLTFKNPDLHVTRSLRNRWHNALIILRKMNFIVSHIFRESNQVADNVANHGLALNSIMFWQDLPLFIKDSFDKNKLGLATYKVSSS